ncbi:putative quinol monooxygenase [Bordetella genomosp. 1]|uniref:ABM domain-containing protein n=1 Tax=Bordetella genomosp. 1 TaxID=1395607 RepID=A0ABX4F1Q3_9BORD|nr:putative quinol monooxygenase [Bordetella genomosp. 1]MDQ8035471.1 putative quinol monooxygenase [Bordetella sp.]OZI65942.1 hypothetical protein CAL27_13220 [Bordetella genomosp. 1]
MTSSLVSKIAVLKARPGQGEALKQALLPLVRDTRAEPGNLEYVLLQDTVNTDDFYVREVFQDDAAFAAHGNAAHFQRFLAQSGPLMQGPITLIDVAVIA